MRLAHAPAIVVQTFERYRRDLAASRLIRRHVRRDLGAISASYPNAPVSTGRRSARPFPSIEQELTARAIPVDRPAVGGGEPIDELPRGRT